MLFISILLSSQVALADETIVDGSSAASTKASVAKMQNKLPDNKKFNFHIALMQIQLSDVKSASEAIEANLHQSLNFEVLAPKIDGLSYKGILELAEKSPTKATISQ